jgi:hypothetical protein
MHETLIERGYPKEKLDANKQPYSFCSQETAGLVLNNVTHWMPLPKPPALN